jgi:hypothetical protein
MKFHGDGLAGDLIESHIEGALPGDEDVLGVDIVLGAGYFEHQANLLRCCCVSHENWYQQLLEFVPAEGFLAVGNGG